MPVVTASAWERDFGSVVFDHIDDLGRPFEGIERADYFYLYSLRSHNEVLSFGAVMVFNNGEASRH